MGAFYYGAAECSQISTYIWFLDEIINSIGILSKIHIISIAVLQNKHYRILFNTAYVVISF
jgi:hypothetical protein